MDPVSKMLADRERATPRMLPWIALAASLHGLVVVAAFLFTRAAAARPAHLPSVSVKIIRPETAPGRPAGSSRPQPTRAAPTAVPTAAPTAAPTAVPRRQPTAAPKPRASEDAMAAADAAASPVPTPAPEPEPSTGGGGAGLSLEKAEADRSPAYRPTFTSPTTSSACSP